MYNKKKLINLIWHLILLPVCPGVRVCPSLNFVFCMGFMRLIIARYPHLCILILSELSMINPLLIARYWYMYSRNHHKWMTGMPEYDSQFWCCVNLKALMITNGCSLLKLRFCVTIGVTKVNINVYCYHFKSSAQVKICSRAVLHLNFIVMRAKISNGT